VPANQPAGHGFNPLDPVGSLLSMLGPAGAAVGAAIDPIGALVSLFGGKR
jgi:hypothetical protein